MPQPSLLRNRQAAAYRAVCCLECATSAALQCSRRPSPAFILLLSQDTVGFRACRRLANPSWRRIDMKHWVLTVLCLQVCWLLLAIKQDQPKNTVVAALRDRCEQAALEGSWVSAFLSSSPNLSHLASL